MKKFRLVLIIILLLLSTSKSSAQYTGYYLGTVYQIVNPGDDSVDIEINYYGQDGLVKDTRIINDLPPGSSQLVRVPSQETGLVSGLYSAVLSSSGKIQVIVNQELYPDGNTTAPVPPFASYAGFEGGSTEVFVTTVAYNYFNYYTDLFIMNIGGSDANVDIQFLPGKQSGIVTGSPLTINDITIAKNASHKLSQKEMSDLGAPDGSSYFTGRFLGSAIITSNEPLAVVINEHNTSAYKLMTFNGVASGSTKVAVPSHMRGYYGYYTATSILNLDDTNPACVKLTYTPDASRSIRSDGITPAEVVVYHVIEPFVSLLRYDGATASDDQSDLDDDIPYTRFYGSLMVESVTGTYDSTTCSTKAEVAVQVNIESTTSGSSQSGATMGSDVSVATDTVSLPNILSDFYGYYTSTQILNLTSNLLTCSVTYTSGPESSVPNHSKTYPHSIPANGMIDLYEGTGGGERGDINTDPEWCASGACRFLGSAKIICDGNIVSFTNEEKNINYKDSMYSWNDFTIAP